MQETMWKVGESIGDKEGRMDVCIAAAGILRPDKDCLEYDAKTFQEVTTASVTPPARPFADAGGPRRSWT